MDTTDGRRVRTFRLRSGWWWGSVAVSPAGATAVVGQSGQGDSPGSSGSVVPIDLRTRTAGRPLSIGGNRGYGGATLEFRPGDNRDVYATTGRWSDRTDRGENIVLRVDLARGTVGKALRIGGDLVDAVHFWPGGKAGYVALVARSGRTSGWRVSTSLDSGGVVADLSDDPGGDSFPADFAGQAPYLVTPHKTRRVGVVDLATGAARIVTVPMFPGEVLTA